MASPYKYRELIKALRKHDKRFDVNKEKGKGSHRVIYHPDVNGAARSLPIPFNGDNADVHPVYVKQIVERFNLPDGTL